MDEASFVCWIAETLKCTGRLGLRVIQIGRGDTDFIFRVLEGRSGYRGVVVLKRNKQPHRKAIGEN